MKGGSIDGAMSLRAYLDSSPHGTGAQLARDCETTHIYICQIAAGARAPSPRMAAKIERYTGGAVTAAMLLPEMAAIFGRGRRR